jgi:hypothetical protein
MGLLRIDNFILSLKTSDNIIAICNAEKKYIHDSYPTIGGRKYAFTAYRNAVKINDFPDKKRKLVLKKLTPDKEELRDYLIGYKKQIKKEHKNLKLIKDCDGYIEKARSLIKNSGFIDNVLGFAALTGRRVAEIGCTAEFEYPKENSEKNIQHLTFSGQLKTRNRADVKPYLIPCLSSTIELKECFNIFRSKYTRYLGQPKLFHNNSKDLSMAVKKHFSSFVEGDIASKDLRAVYATITCRRFKNDNKQTDQTYIADILGHSEFDLTTCQSYFDYRLDV